MGQMISISTIDSELLQINIRLVSWSVLQSMAHTNDFNWQFISFSFARGQLSYDEAIYYVEPTNQTVTSLRSEHRVIKVSEKNFTTGLQNEIQWSVILIFTTRTLTVKFFCCSSVFTWRCVSCFDSKFVTIDIMRDSVVNCLHAEPCINDLAFVSCFNSSISYCSQVNSVVMAAALVLREAVEIAEKLLRIEALFSKEWRNATVQWPLLKRMRFFWP